MCHCKTTTAALPGRLGRSLAIGPPPTLGRSAVGWAAELEGRARLGGRTTLLGRWLLVLLGYCPAGLAGCSPTRLAGPSAARTPLGRGRAVGLFDF